MTDTNLYKNLILKFIKNIKKKHGEISQEMSLLSEVCNNLEFAFKNGEGFSYFRALDIMQTQARLLDMDLQELGLKNL